MSGGCLGSPFTHATKRENILKLLPGITPTMEGGFNVIALNPVRVRALDFSSALLRAAT